MAADPASAAPCPNCGTALPAPRPRFCPGCGQETWVRPPTLGEFLQQFGGAYLSTEGALWRTLALLVARPGELTRRYLAGRRKHYVLPLRLYLTVSVIVLLLLRGAAVVDVRAGQQALTGVPPAELAANLREFTVIDLGERRAGTHEGRFYCEGLPAWLCGRLERRLALEPRALQAEAAALPERFIEHFGRAMFLLVPLFALGLKLLYRNRGLRYTEHLVFALHLHAFWFLALALTLLPVPPVAGLAGLAMPVYAFLAERRVYGGRWWATLAREAVLASAYGTALGLTLGMVVMLVLLG